MEYLGAHWEWVLILLCLAFLVAGFVDSIAGGGGFISTPCLLLAGIPPHLALGTNKFIVIFGTAAASLNFILHKKVLWNIVLLGIVCSSLGAYFGSRVVLNTQEGLLKTFILIILPLAALIALIPRKFHSGKNTFSFKETFLTAPILCLIVGFYDGYFGPGTGSFLILGFYMVLKMDLLYASGSAKVINLASGIGSFAAFLMSGHVLYVLGIPLIICNMLGGYLGSRLALQRGAKTIRIMVIFVFVLMFVSLIMQYRKDLYATMSVFFSF